MSDIKTVILDGGELKVEGLGGQNTVIVNRGSAALYASASANVTPDGDNTAAIPSGGIMNLRGTNGTVYLLGTGKVELEGTDYADIGRAAVVSSGGSGGGSGGGVSQEYVDSADAVILSSAKKYTDSEIVKAKAYTDAESDKLSGELSDLKAYIGYTDSDIYGLEADFENNKFTRLAGAVGKNPGADFDSINAFGGRRRCALHDDGTVYAYYGEDNYEEALDGLVGDGFTQVMVEQPKFYYKIVPLKTEKNEDADGYHLYKARYYVTDTPKPGFKVHPAFVKNGVEIDKIYLSAFEGCIRDISAHSYIRNDSQVADFDNDTLSSIINAKPASGTTQALTRTNARKLAQNRGTGWGITTIQSLSATQLLFMIEYATFNSQSAIGNGVVNVMEPINTGSTSSLGNISGFVDSGGVTYRGEENLWGNMWCFVDGINCHNDIIYSFDPDSENTLHIKIGILPGNGFINAFNYSEEGIFIASKSRGNSALPVGDYVWHGPDSEQQSLWATGGYNERYEQIGLFCQSFVHKSSRSSKVCGARLVYIPQPETVTQEVTAND